MDKGARTEQIIAMLSKGMIEPKITVVGCGGAGNNVVQRVFEDCRTRVETVAVNTDETKLDSIEADKKVLIGKDVTNGAGACGFPEVGEYCADRARDAFRQVLDGSDIVIIVAGMGGGTGTGAAPIIAEVSKELDAVTFGIAINPFSYENERVLKAGEGIRRLRETTETTVVLDNDKLLQYAGDVPVSEAFAVMDRSIIKIIDSLCLQIGESFISQITPEIEEMVQRIDEEEGALAPPATPEAELIHASIGELDGAEPATELPSPLELR
ncbi:MAG: hypothetical protein LUO79_04470 [Methanomassiliicoccales archaeon]|nr:hypothetical protein [Methanomassiliicoccales archaeon]